MGRPFKLTDAIQARLVEAVSGGASYKAACDYADIDFKTWLSWLRRGERESSGIFFQFFHQIRQAEGKAAVRNILVLQKAATEGDWRAALAWLERRYPDEWSANQHIDVTLIQQQVAAEVAAQTGREPAEILQFIRRTA